MPPAAPSPESDPILEPLNEVQRRAVLHADGPLLVLAGPGSGKTRVITHRIAHLVRLGTPAESILAITFTNKAAGEMRERVASLLGFGTRWISTFHSFSARVLRRHIYRLEPFTSAFTIYDADDSLSLIKECIAELDLATDQVTPRQIRAEISRMKNSGIEDAEVLPPGLRLHERLIRLVFSRYCRALEERNALDFDDLLLFLERLLRTQPDLLERYREQFRYVLIDEFQDTNQVQYRIGQLLASGHRNLCVTGDPDQSIYSWRGADIGNILSFEQDFPDATLVKLEQNYRSTRSILRVANASIRHNALRKEKELWTENPEGDAVQIHRFSSSEEEAFEIADLVDRLRSEGCSLSEIAIFYRINALSRELERALVLRGVPYVIVGAVEFYARKEVKDILAYLRLLANPRDTESLKRIINVPARRIGKVTVERLTDTARVEQRPPLEVVLDDDLRRKTLKGSSAERVGEFAALYRELAAAPRSPVAPLLGRVLQRVDYEQYLEGFDPETSEDRMQNVEELLNAAQQYDEREPEGDLEDFLREISLLTSVDRWESGDRVSLMTLHLAKGLEFPVVIVSAIEEGLLPLIRAGADSPDDLEEERRLFYVGLTRAKEKLYLSHAKTRMRFGRSKPALPSSFLREIHEAAALEPDSQGALEVDAETRRSLERIASNWDDFFDPDPSLGGGRRRRQFVDEDDDLTAGRFSADEWDDDVLDEDPYPDGARVMHDIYGEGRVVSSSGLGRRRRLIVEFESAGRKSLVLGYAKLRRITT